MEHVNDVSTVSLRSTCSSWYVGTNIPGRPRVFMPYIGGFPVYVQKCNEVMNNAYEGFVLKGARLGNAPPQVHFTERWQRAARHRGDFAGRRGGEARTRRLSQRETRDSHRPLATSWQSAASISAFHLTS